MSSNNFYINHFCCQMGNHILTYNNICQMAHSCGGTVSIIDTGEIHKYFKNIKTHSEKKNGKEVNCYNIRSGFKYWQKNDIILIEPYLGELFCYLNKYDPRDFMEIKEEYQIVLDKNKTNIAIHLRKHCNCPYGTRPVMNGKIFCKCIKSERKIYKNDAFYDYDYILNSINFCIKNFKNPHFIIFGVKNKNQFSADFSDMSSDRKKWEESLLMSNFKPYEDLLEHFKKNPNISYELSITQKDESKAYIYDFSQMSECDVIISSPSTFCFGASILGKKNKYIIHNKNMFEHLRRINDPGDIFWFELYDNKSSYYKINKYI